MKDTILKRTEGKYTIHVFKEMDECPDLSYLEQDYADEGPEERTLYREQDQTRLDTYHRGDWYMVGVVCQISVKTKTNWAVDPVVAKASVWGVESDSDESYFLEVAEDMITEAKADLANMKEAICS